MCLRDGCAVMNCPDVQDRLSAYYDGEVSVDTRAAIDRHLAECEACACELLACEQVTRAISRMPHPKLPDTIWDGVAAELQLEASVGSSVAPAVPRQDSSRKWWTSRQFALAASILLALGVGYWVTRDRGHSVEHPHHAEFGATMDHYLRLLRHDPDGAGEWLRRRYDGQAVNADGAVTLVGYRPAVGKGLPTGYSLDSMSVLQMPCCTCVKAVCKREDGSTLVLFEHDDAKAEWFADRPSSMAMCGDEECCLVKLDSSIAATWKRGSRSVTAVGVRDIDEVNTLVSWLNQNAAIAL